MLILFWNSVKRTKQDTCNNEWIKIKVMFKTKFIKMNLYMP